MFNRIIRFSIAYRHAVVGVVVLFVALGVVSYRSLVIDAVPDITNVQVQINTEASGYSPLEVEQRITTPIEIVVAGLPGMEYSRSLSRYGLSQVTVVFRDGTDIYFARQLVSQRLQEVKARLPEGVSPQLGPIATGLGEIFLYTLGAKPGATRGHTLQELRELQDWVVKPQLRTVAGVVEINSIGGSSKQIVVTPDMDKLRAAELTLEDLSEALARNNLNVGAGFIEQGGEQFLIRAPSQVSRYEEIGEIPVKTHESAPVLVKDVASVGIGSELRAGAATANGEEVVLGTIFMLIGENGRDVSERVKIRLQEIARSLPSDVEVRPLYDRSTLVNATIHTVKSNLFEGALLVVAVLFAALGNLRAALITSCVIPISMLLTIMGMVQSKLSANLLSLGAIDFGLIVDGAVILVENCVRRLNGARAGLGRALTREERLTIAYEASSEVRQATMFGELIIMVVYVPILALTGVEGKMFHPMAIAVLFALTGAFILSLTFVPAAVALFVREGHGHAVGWGDRVISWYGKSLNDLLERWRAVLYCALAFLVVSFGVGSRLGSEFVPSLDEGDVALHALRIPGTSLSQAIDMQHSLETALRAIPEVRDVFAKIGTAEIATDPMPPSVADGYVMLKPRAEWPDPHKPKSEVVRALEGAVAAVPGNNYEFTQPIQMRFNELIAGVRSDLAVKIFGDDMTVLSETAEAVEGLLSGIEGVSDLKVEQVSGLPVVEVRPDMQKIGRMGLSASAIQGLVRTSFAGQEVSRFYDGDRSFPIVVRLSDRERANLVGLRNLPIAIPSGSEQRAATLESFRSEFVVERPDRPYTTLGDVSTISITEGPNQISRENGKRRVVVTANVRGRDLGSFVQEAQALVARSIKTPEGYWLGWGGQYENLLSANRKLSIIVPIVLVSVFGLIYLTLQSFSHTLAVFTGLPFALSGGVLALAARGIPFSISAAIGFIALSGISVLNGLVLVTFSRKLLHEGGDIRLAVVNGAMARLRPVLMTALVASLGFLPMAISQGTGSEVQRPLATVVIGGIASSTALTLVVLPILLLFIETRWGQRRRAK